MGTMAELAAVVDVVVVAVAVLAAYLRWRGDKKRDASKWAWRRRHGES